jgi:hypothetical protein
MGAVMHLVQQLGEEVVEGHCAVLAGGGRVGVMRNADEALACLDAWGIPQARRPVVRGCVAA